MQELQLSEIKEISYNILKETAHFCEKNCLTYFLACGTALGAIRHNGFIPWDDDIDIAMPREDYEKFLSIYSSARYELRCIQKDANYLYPFAKIIDTQTVLIENVEHPCKLGVYIDIFPIDGLPKSKKERSKHMKRLAWDMRLISWKRISTKKKLDFQHKLIQKTMRVLLMSISIQRLIQRIDTNLKKYPYSSSDFVGHFVTKSIWGNDVKPRVIFEHPVKHQFMDSSFYVPGDYKRYLKLEYGDYMKLPPKEKQITHHDYVAYWKKEN